MTAGAERGDEGTYYRDDLALVHHRGFGFHADMCAPGVVELLRPVRERDGLVVEIGCGSGLLTRHLLDAGHRVLATDASPAMLDLARDVAPDAEDIRPLVLPDDPVPEADAVVGVGHALSYLPDEASIERALVAIAQALRPGGVLAIDICDHEWAATRRDWSTSGRAGDDWAIITEYSIPAPDRFVRDMTIFVRNDDGSWRRDREHHDNVMIDTGRVPDLLAPQGVDVRVARSFGDEQLPAGLRALVGHRPYR
jgi:SAM-dependent methyltransferase